MRAVNPVNPLSFDATPSTFSWRVGLAPDTTITLAEVIIPDPTDPAPTLRLGFTGSDDLTNPIELEFECRLDSAAFETCSAPAEYDLTTLTPGPHRFEVRAVDSGGSFDASPARHDFTVEPAPDTTIVTGPDPVGDGVTATSATFTFASDMAGATFECRLDLDPAGFTACASGVTYTGLALGEHLLEVRAKTPAGTVDLEPAEYEWLIGDDTPPTAEILTGPPQAPATTTDTTVTFTFTGDANGGSPLTFQCSLSGPVERGAAGLRRRDRLDQPDAARRRRVHVRADPGHAAPARRRRAGGVGVRRRRRDRPARRRSSTGPTSDRRRTSSADRPPPSSSPPTRRSRRSSARSTRRRGRAAARPQEFSDLPPGETTLSVRAIDVSGNVDETPATKTWTVFGPPETTIDSAPPATTTEQTATFAFSSDQTGVTFECSLDGANFVDCTSPVTYSDLAVTPHTFEVQATNVVGLTDETAALHEWAVVLPPDTTPPIAQVVTGPPATTTATQAMFTFSANEPAVTYECAVDGGDFGSCANPFVITEVEPGAHSLAVRATDSAGNVGPASPLWTWTVDGPADTTITSGPLDETHDTTATFEFSANEAGVSFQCSLDGAAYTPCTSPVTYTGLAPDSHTLRVRSVDSAGNVEPEPAEWSWDILESEPPEATITNNPPATTTRHDRHVHVHLRRVRLDVRLLARPRRRGAVHVAEAVHRPRHRDPRVRRQGDRPGRQHLAGGHRTRGRSRRPTRRRRCRASAAGPGARRRPPAPRSRSRRTRPA